MKYNLYNCNKTRIGKSPISGRGVLASDDISADELIEQCHFIIPERDKGGQDKELGRYMFFFVNGKSERESEELAIGALFSDCILDEEIKQECKDNVRDLGYDMDSFGKLFCFAVVLGNGMIFNHSSDPNVKTSFNYEDFCFDYTANADIKKGDELTIDYLLGLSEEEILKIRPDLS